MPTKQELATLTHKLQQVKMMILNRNPFYGILLMKLSYAITNKELLIATDGKKIFFGYSHISELAEMTLDDLSFLLQHELLHLILGHHKRRKYVSDKDKFDIASDLIVNSFIYQDGGNSDFSVLYQGEVMPHQFNDKEASDYSVDELSGLFTINYVSSDHEDEDSENKPSGHVFQLHEDIEDENDISSEGSAPGDKPVPDSHEEFNDDYDDTEFESEVISAFQASQSKAQGLLPLGVKRLLKEIMAPKIDWKEVLKDFLSFSLEDYSFTPPDYRYDGSEFFLPGYNTEEETLENILFLIDTSGSMSDEDIGKVFSMIKETLNQFNGHVKGKLSFFDTRLYGMYSFENEEDLKSIRPRGGGGTSFKDALHQALEECQDDLPKAIVVLTDGYGGAVEEQDCPDIPILWLLDNTEVEEPAIGRSIRININELASTK